MQQSRQDIDILAATLVRTLMTLAGKKVHSDMGILVLAIFYKCIMLLGTQK